MSQAGSFDGVKGLGAKRIAALVEAGITSAAELVALLPRAYYDTGAVVSAKSCVDGEPCVLRGRVSAKPVIRYIRKGLSITSVAMDCTSGGGIVRAVFYNRPYLNWKEDETRYLFGTAGVKRGSVSVINPVACTDAELTAGGILCVYPKIKDVPPAVIKEAVKSALNAHKADTVIPLDIAERCGLVSSNEAYRLLHEPDSMADVDKAAVTASVEELVRRMVMFYILKSNLKPRDFEYTASEAGLYERLGEAFPYRLNDGQIKAIGEIIADLKSERLLNRLLMGDVGSGKSAVAYAVMVFAAMSGFQSVIMSPTDILARQHFANITRLFPDITVEFLSSSQSAAARRAALFNIASGAADIVVGTHALIQKGVEFCSLRLAVTDELHRFGVAQRSALEEKGGGVDTLLLSATPIPRSMALVMYGDLSISRLEARAGGECDVITSIVPEHKLEDMYAYIRRRADEGAVTFVVCPRVEDGEGEYETESVKDIYSKLTTGALKGAKTGLLHGKMKDHEKAEVIASLTKGDIKVLIATTVIEVGVDIKSAENIIIFNADRYGLAQLHQLRGRVGRQGQRAYCFLLTQSKNPDALKRLEILRDNNDGFLLSEHDLATRGAGDFIGLNQHGFSAAFRLDKATIDMAKDITAEIVERLGTKGLSDKIDPALARYVRSITLN